MEAMAGVACEDLANRIVASRVGAEGAWKLVILDADGRARVEDASAVAVAVADARITYKSERVFEALMDEEYGSARAVALGRLRVQGDLKVAAATEALYDAAEARLRVTRDVVDVAAAAAEARRREEALDARLVAAAARPRSKRIIARHVGTDQQLGAVLLTIGGALSVRRADLPLMNRGGRPRPRRGYSVDG